MSPYQRVGHTFVFVSDQLMVTKDNSPSSKWFRRKEGKHYQKLWNNQMHISHKSLWLVHSAQQTTNLSSLWLGNQTGNWSSGIGNVPRWSAWQISVSKGQSLSNPKTFKFPSIHHHGIELHHLYLLLVLRIHLSTWSTNKKKINRFSLKTTPRLTTSKKVVTFLPTLHATNGR